MVQAQVRILVAFVAGAACVALAAIAPGVAVAAKPAISSLTLEWTSPGDDGTIGVATRYELRYSKSPITADNFFQATLAPDLPHPAKAGHHEKVKVRGLEADQRYYFAIRTVDDQDNWSGLSNVVGKTSPDPEVQPSLYTLAMSAPFPNPTRSAVSLVLTLPEPSDVLIEVLDVTGRWVRTLVNGPMPAGESPLRWSLTDHLGAFVPYGNYWVLGHVGDRHLTQRLTVVP